MTTTVPTPHATSVSRDESLASLAVKHPAASRVFHRHHLDFCCGGANSLASACAAAGLDADAVLREIQGAGLGPVDPAVAWAERPLDELVAHILREYHAPLWPELERLEQMAEKVLRVHGDKDPARLGRLAAVVHELAEDLRQHMAKEENILFPWIQSGNGRTAGAPVSVMQREHVTAAAQLRQIEELTDRFDPPGAACNTWRALYLGLGELDRALEDHMHLENNVLFPRALSE